MKVLAYCCQSYARSVRKAAGVDPITCPPLDANTIDVSRFEGYDLLYLDLHGRPDDTAWYGDDRSVAMTAGQVRQIDLSGTVVFAANCYLGDENAPMMSALLDAGAKSVIAAPGKNYGGKKNLTGASRLGQWLRIMLSVGTEIDTALESAKRIVKAQRIRATLTGSDKLSDAIDDTLEFQIHQRKREGRKA